MRAFTRRRRPSVIKLAKSKLSAVIAAVLTSLLLPPEWAGGSGLFTPVAIEKGGIRELEFEIKNGCAKRATFQVELGGGLRTIASLGSTDPRIRQQLALGGTIDVLPGEPASVQLRLAPTMGGKYSGALTATCKNCGRTCRQGAGTAVYKHQVGVTALDLDVFRARVQSFVGPGAADLPVRLSNLRVVGRVDDAHRAAFEMLLSSAFLERPGPAKRLQSESPADTETAEFIDRHSEEIRTATDEMVAQGFVEEDWYYVEVAWQHEDGGEFKTLAAADERGHVRFEPVLHFHGEKEVGGADGTAPEAAETTRATPTWRQPDAVHAVLKRPAPARREITRPGESGPAFALAAQAPAGPCTSYRIKNGFGRYCVDVRWQVATDLACSRARHLNDLQVTRDRPASGCILWRQKTLIGDACGVGDDGHLERSWAVKVWYQKGIGEHLRIDTTRRESIAGRMRLVLRDADPSISLGTTVEADPGWIFGHSKNELITDRTHCPAN